jgi:membrane-bound serine protease (ClpP class)
MSGPVILAIVCGIAFIVFVIYAIVLGQKRKLSAGIEDMVGKEAVAQTTINPRGRVLVEGELWTAMAENDNIASGEEVIVTKVEKLKVWVKRKPETKGGK